MPTKNKENKGLPPRWRIQAGSYYYRVPPGQESAWDGKQSFKLGRSLAEASDEWAKRVKLDPSEIRTIDRLLDRYAFEVIPKKGVNTQASNKNSLPRLRKAFGHMKLTEMKAQFVYRYADHYKNTRSSHTDLEVLSHAFTKAVQWGLIESHPYLGQVRLQGQKPRARHVEDWEIKEILALKPVRSSRDSTLTVQAYLKLKILTGMRKQDLLTLKWSDIKADGILFTPMKTEGTTAKRILIERTDALNLVLDECKRIQRFPSDYVIASERGFCYYNFETRQPPGFKAIFQRFVKRVLSETKVTESFTDHDFRAVAASAATDLSHAQALLGHASSETTKKHYRRGTTKVKPTQ